MTNYNNNTNPATNNTPAINFRAPINVKMPVNVNFNAPITVNLTYNGATEEKTLEKVNTADVSRYFAEATEGQCETVNPRVPSSDETMKSWVTSKPDPKPCNVPTCDAPAPKRDCGCTRIDIPIRDRDEKPTYKYDEKRGTGCGRVAEVTIDDLAESLGNQVNLYFDNILTQIAELEKELDCQRKRSAISTHFKKMIEIEQDYLIDHLKYLKNKKRYGF